MCLDVFHDKLLLVDGELTMLAAKNTTPTSPPQRTEGFGARRRQTEMCTAPEVVGKPEEFGAHEQTACRNIASGVPEFHGEITV